MRVMDAKLSLFIAQTGADPALARDLLEGNEWNVENAVKVYKLMQNSALPPAGLPKNVDPKRNNLAATGGGLPATSGGLPATGGGLPKTGPVPIVTSGGGIPATVTMATGGGLLGKTITTTGVGGGGGPVPGSVLVPGSVPVPKAGLMTCTVATTTLPMQQAVVTATSPGTTRKLKRGLSKTTENLALVSQARDLVLNDIEEKSGEVPPHFVETPDLTFVLPDLTVYSEDFRAYLHKDLIETSTLVSLEQAGRLNWWADVSACQRLLPLATTGDGNCLLHAASLGMWGFHDRLLTLRKALYTTLTSSTSKGALWRRWRWHQTQANKESGLVYSEEEWQTEWENLLKLASAKPRTTPGSNTSCCSGPVTKGLMERTIERDATNNTQTEVFYESLEEFHVFVLAHVLRRPIVVVADTILKDSNGEALAPIPFGGIYLPIECSPSQCHRTPLLLTYDASHFSALVAMETDTSPEDKPGLPAIPLVDPEFKLLPIHYMLDPGEDFIWGKSEEDESKMELLKQKAEDRLSLIKKYLDIETIPIPPGGTNTTNNSTPVHQQQQQQLLPQYQNNLVVDLDLGSQPRSRSNSHSGSVDSDENNSIGSSGSVKDGKDKDGKSKVAKQMQTVAKSFGSIGKTMSKKLKKNFGGAGKAMKDAEKTKEKEKKKLLRRTSVGSVTQSTKVTSVTAEMLRSKDTILCVKLSHKRMEYQEEMVRNYLLAAQERFKQDRELRRQQDVEMRLKVELRGSREVLEGDIQTDGADPDETDGAEVTVTGNPSNGGVLSPRMQCINAGCDSKGSASTSYLCPKCYEKEKQQAIDFERGPVAADGRPILGGANSMTLERQNTLINCGRSKFYTLSDDEHYGNVSHVNLAAKSLKHPPLPSKHETILETSEQLNNAKLLRDKKNSYINSTMGGVRIARSTFYDEAPQEFKPQPITTTMSNNSTAGAAAKAALPPGTAYVVNDLHQRPSSGAAQPANERLFGLVSSNIDPTIEPPLRPEFQNLNGLANKSQQQHQQHQYNKSNKLEESSMSKPIMVTGGGGTGGQVGSQSGVLTLAGSRQKCRTLNCPFYGTDVSDFLCSACYRKKQQQTLNHLSARTAMR